MTQTINLEPNYSTTRATVCESVSCFFVDVIHEGGELVLMCRNDHEEWVPMPPTTDITCVGTVGLAVSFASANGSLTLSENGEVVLKHTGVQTIQHTLHIDRSYTLDISYAPSLSMPSPMLVRRPYAKPPTTTVIVRPKTRCPDKAPEF